MSLLRRRGMMHGQETKQLNGLVDRVETGSGYAYTISNNTFTVTTYGAKAILFGQFKYPVHITSGDTVFLQEKTISGSFAGFQDVKLYLTDGQTIGIPIAENKALAVIEAGITYVAKSDVEIGYISVKKRTGSSTLPAIFSFVLKINGADIIN